MAPPTELTRREFLRLGLGLAAGPALLAACAKSDENVVNFFNWSTYIGKETLPRFAQRTGIKVNYENFADEEEMFAKIKSGARGYDLIVGTDYMIPRFKALNLIDPYPQGVLKNLGNIDPKFREPSFDPGLAFTVPYLWGTTGIGFNKRLVSKAPTSWSDLWDPKYAGKISMLDNARDCVGVALRLAGHGEQTGDSGALEKARELLVKQRPLVRQYSSTTYVDSLVSGETALAMAWSGDILQAAKDNPQLDYVIPKEGSFIWVDSMCLVRGSEHRAGALQLVDYLIEGETAAEIANTVRYASPNAAARAHIDAEIRNDPRVYPPAKTAERLSFHHVLEPDAAELWNRTWSDVKVS